MSMQFLEIPYAKHTIHESISTSLIAAINTNATIKKTSAKKTHTHEKNRLKETC